MINREERERFFKLSEEERKAEMLDSISDAVRVEAHHLAMLKAISNKENGIEPEEFDKAFERELNKAWNKVKDKSSVELAFIGMLEMATNGFVIEDIVWEVKE